jgi:hypothetical protein
MPGTEPCPHCDRPVKRDARQCPHCQRWIDDEDDQGDSKYRPCPQCGARGAKRILWTFWGSFYGPALMAHVRCPKCHAAYNGKTGKSNGVRILVFCLLVYGFLLLLVGVPIGLIVMTVVSGMR